MSGSATIIQLNCWAASRGSSTRRTPRSASRSNTAVRVVKVRPGPRSYVDFHGPDSLCSAQPKKSAAPIFRTMLRTHEDALDRARDREPAGQLAARELEVQRIDGALHRADALDDDVAAAIEAAC